VETERLDPVRPAGVLGPQILVELEQRPPLEDLPGWDVALGQPTCREQLAEQFASALSVLARRFGPRSAEVSAGSARCAVTPALSISSAMYRQPVQPSIVNATGRVEPGQPARQMLPVSRGDPAAFPFVVLLIDPVECQLLPVDVQATYD
jgi:hypothetical protein